MAAITLWRDFPGYPLGTVLTETNGRYVTVDGGLWFSADRASEEAASAPNEAASVVLYIPQPTGEIATVRMSEMNTPLAQLPIPPNVFTTEDEAQAYIDLQRGG